MFKLKENGTKVSTEILAGLTTFVTMAYIIAVNPGMLSLAGMEWGAVFLATIIAAIIGTLIMGLVANVPYAQAPGMGLNALFVFTVCFTYGFSWQHALSMVFICGLINILITVTKIRKHIIKAIPKSLQNAIGGGIGIFIAYVGLLNIGAINFGAGVPSMTVINTGGLYVFFIGLVLTIVLLLLKVKGAILIGIIVSTLIGIPLGVTTAANSVTFKDAIAVLPTTFGVIFTKAGLGSLLLILQNYQSFFLQFSHSACLIHSILSVHLSEQVVRQEYSAKKMRKQWNPVQDSNPRWTKHYLQMLQQHQ
jgi:AGZA family xanthine/uracil permease-like MFS transporter